MTRTLGGTGADVTTLSYGAMELRGRPRGPEIADEDAGRLLNSVLDRGINLIDTSPDYGRSEELIGSYIGILAITNLLLSAGAAERRHAERAVSESEKRFRAVVEDQTDMICRFKPDGILTFVNEAFCRFHGKPAAVRFTLPD